MGDYRITNLANILVNYSTKVQKGDWVFIRADFPASSLVQETVRCVLEAGGNPTVMFDADDVTATYYKHASPEQIAWVSPLEDLLYHKIDVMIHIGAPLNTRVFNGVPPKTMQKRQLARRELTQVYLERAASGSLRWVLTQFPCQALAQDADMNLAEFEDFVYAATFADQEDPIQPWIDTHHEQERIIEWLKGKKDVVVRGPNVDLQLSIEDRKFINSDGRNNMPSGEVFTGPVENSANGWIKFTYPAISRGREVEGVELEFKEGKVVNARAEKNEAFLRAMLDSDEGSRYLGEFAIGTNFGIKRFTRSILFDEKIGGSIHLAVGAGYPETGSVNHSSIHWDFICDMRDDSEIWVDDELLYKNGAFRI